MTKFKIPIYWKNYGEIEVEEETLGRAIRSVELDENDLPLPDNWDLVEGSIEVSYELAEAYNPGHKISDEPPRKELEAKDFGIQEKEPSKVEEVCDDEERESRRHLGQLGEGYQEDTEEEGGEDEEG